MGSTRVKRSRIGRSPSYDGAGLRPNQIGAPAAEPSSGRRFDSHSISASGKAFNQSVVAMAENSMSGPPLPETAILTLSSPEVAMEDGEEWNSGENFLEKCYYCSKRIGEKDDVFMYRSFRAFCTPFCRAKVINKDVDFKKEFKHFYQTMFINDSKKNKLQS